MSVDTHSLSAGPDLSANTPEDDEPWTDEDEAAVAESRADVAAGRTLSHEEMLRKHG